MATSKQSFARATEPQCSASAQREEETHIQASLTTMYVHSVPAPGLQPYPQAQRGALQDATVVPMFLPSSLTLHIPSSTALQQQRLVAPATSARPKSVGKHICPHCGKDCLKPSVLEKHLRCHTGERPYPCTTCGISFKTQSNLYKHKRTQAHARLSSESDKGTFSSQESMESSKDSCTSPSLEVNCGDSADIKRNKEVLPPASEAKTMPGIEWALHNAAMVGISTTPALQDKVNSTVEFSLDVENNVSMHPTVELSEDECTRVTSNRTPLQRQEALFSKPSFPFHSKAQSHDSTDSGFSDSSEHHSSSSPGASLHDPNMESLTETTERQDPGDSTEDSKSKVSIQEKQKLEERISKLIYENSVLVDNKQLENVRPRKTILSKQGSIDLPVPYTYKDSFHFEIRNSKHISQNQDRGGGAIHIALPTQHSASLVHAPLTRSSSLPFTMGGKPADGAMNLNLSRRCSAGHVYPLRSPDQQATGHRSSLVRQVAVDAEGSLVERGSMSSLSSDGDSTDVGTEPCIKGNYRKKARKFDYTKWHTYKGGTFRKLYNSEKDCPLKMKKTASISEPPESLEIHTSQQRDNGSVNSSGSVVTLQNGLDNNHVKGADIKRDELVTQHTDCHIPSERKKQRTGDDPQTLSIPGDGCGLSSQLLPPACAAQNLHPQGSFMHPFSNPNQFLGNTHNSAVCLVSVSGTSATPSASISSPTVPEAKTSFPPMYQLKIPCPTDGASASCSGSTLTHNTCSTIPALMKSHQTTVEFHLENGVLSSKQSHTASTSFDRNMQDASCVTTSMPMLSVSCSGLNTLSKVPTQLQSTTPTPVSPVSLLQSNCATGEVEKLSTDPVYYYPLQVLTTSENTQPVTSENTTSTVSYCGELGQQMHSPVSTTPRVQNHPESGKQNGLTSDAKPEVYENLSKLHTGDESQSEGNLILLNGSAQAQNMFYVRTADLQIVMQLISDEQLALIEPHIETTTSVTLTKQTSLSQEVCQSDVAQEMKNNGASNSCECLANQGKTVCSLSSQTDQIDPGNIPQCVSSWSHSQTKFHVSATADIKSSTQTILDISHERNFEVTTDSHRKHVAEEPHLLDKSFNRRETEECPIYTHTFTEDQTNAEITRDLSHLMESNHNQAIKNPEAGELNETLSGNGESVHTNTTQLRTCFCEKKTSTAESQVMYKVLNSTVQPTQSKPYLEMKELSKHGTETFCSGQISTQSELQEAFALETGDFGSDALIPNRTSNIQRAIEDSTKCGNIHTHHSSLEIFTEPEEDDALESLRFQESPGTERRKTIAKEDGDGSEEVKELSTDVADTNNTSQGSADYGKQDKRKEDATSCKEHQGESFKTSESLQHDKFNPEASVCTIILSQCSQSQEKCNNNAKRDSMGEHLGLSQETSQQQTTSKSVSKYSNQTHRCPALENTTQSEFQKETRAATSYWIYSKGSQTLTSQHKMSGTTVLDANRTETLNGSIPPSSSSHQESHTHQISPSGNSTEPKHIYLGNNSYLEHEDSNSSSDDEQKLVIELE